MSQPSTYPSFEALFDEHMARLWALSFRLCGAREDAEDLLQEAAVIGFRSFGKFEPDTNFAAWMSMILVNAHRNRFRAQTHRIPTVSLDSLNEDGVGENLIYERLRSLGRNERRGDPVARLFDALDGEMIVRAFGSLPEDFRECCSLFWIAELPYEEIARVLGVPLGTVRSRLHRGRKLLQRALWSVALERGIVRGDEKVAGTSGAKLNLLIVVFCLGAFAREMFL